MGHGSSREMTKKTATSCEIPTVTQQLTRCHNVAGVTTMSQGRRATVFKHASAVYMTVIT